MKYLKSYSIFENWDRYDTKDRYYDNGVRAESIKGGIVDMSLDIQDEGFRVKAEDDKDPYYPSFGYAPNLHITIDKFDKGYRDLFSLNDIKDFLLRIFEYDRTNPCEIEVFTHEPNHNNQKTKITYSEKLGFLKWNGNSCSNLNYKVTYVFIKVRIFK